MWLRTRDHQRVQLGHAKTAKRGLAERRLRILTSHIGGTSHASRWWGNPRYEIPLKGFPVFTESNIHAKRLDDGTDPFNQGISHPKFTQSVPCIDQIIP